MSQSMSSSQDGKESDSSERRFVNNKDDTRVEKDDYLDAANAIIKKVELQQGKEVSKLSENDADDTDYVARAQEILNRYKDIEKNNSTSKFIDEGISETNSMDKYDITGLTNSNSLESSSPIIHLSTQRDKGFHNHTKNGLHDKNITIVPMKNQKISYEFNKGDSPRLINNKDKTKTENAVQAGDTKQHASDSDHVSHDISKDKAKQSGTTKKHNTDQHSSKSNNEIEFTKTPEEEKHAEEKENENTKHNDLDLSFKALSEEKHYEGEKENKDIKHNDLDLSEKAERAYASIDIDSEAVKNAIAAENMPSKYIEPKKNQKEEDVSDLFIDNTQWTKTCSKSVHIKVVLTLFC